MPPCCPPPPAAASLTASPSEPAAGVALLTSRTAAPKAASVGPDSNDPDPVHSLIQDHAVGRFLKERGYRYVHAGDDIVMIAIATGLIASVLSDVF